MRTQRSAQELRVTAPVPFSKTEWKCSECAFQNDKRSRECAGCGHKMPKFSWKEESVMVRRILEGADVRGTVMERGR